MFLFLNHRIHIGVQSCIDRLGPYVYNKAASGVVIVTRKG